MTHKTLASEPVRLTTLSHRGGCACKFRPADLARVLGGLPGITDPRVLVGHESSDDAAAYRLEDGRAVVVSVDFFAPVVDGAHDFGRVAAANALSDIYAMGATPAIALNLVGWPVDELGLDLLEEVLAGAGTACADAGALVLGGHSIDALAPHFGVCAVGFAEVDQLWRNNTPCPGDALILTKPLGSGIITTAIKLAAVDAEVEAAAISVMATLNRSAAEVLRNHGVSACTDVTGYGLLGHAWEMAAGGVCLEIRAGAVPVLPGVRDLAVRGVIPSGTRANLDWLGDHVRFASQISPVERLVLADAQTSGGLLASVPGPEAENALAELESAGVSAAIVGRVLPGAPGLVVEP